MILKYKKVLVFFVLMFGFLLVGQLALAGNVLTPNSNLKSKSNGIALTPSQAEALGGLEDSANIGLGDATSEGIPFSGMSPAEIIGRIVGLGLSFIGVLFFGLLVYAGIKWMLARGNDEDVKKAIDLIQAAIFGLMVVMAAYAFTTFLTGAFMDK